MRTPGKLLLGEPIRQATVCDGVRPHFCYAYWFFKGNKLKSCRTSGQGYVRYALPFALPIDWTLELKQRPIKQSNGTRLCMSFL
jgi:hypothetical protein